MNYLLNKKSIIFIGIYTVCILLTGIVVGHWIAKDQVKHTAFYFKDHPKKQGKQMLAHFTKKLNLSDIQAKKMDDIFKKQGLAIKQIRQNVKTEYKIIKDTHTADILQILTPDQQEAFKKLQVKHDKRHHKKKRFNKHYQY